MMTMRWCCLTVRRYVVSMIRGRVARPSHTLTACSMRAAPVSRFPPGVAGSECSPWDLSPRCTIGCARPDVVVGWVGALRRARRSKVMVVQLSPVRILRSEVVRHLQIALASLPSICWQRRVPSAERTPHPAACQAPSRPRIIMSIWASDRRAE